KFLTISLWSKVKYFTCKLRIFKISSGLITTFWAVWINTFDFSGAGLFFVSAPNTKILLKNNRIIVFILSLISTNLFYLNFYQLIIFHIIINSFQSKYIFCKNDSTCKFTLLPILSEINLKSPRYP